MIEPKPVASVFLSTQTFAEILWLQFFRGFFAQKTMMVMNDAGGTEQTDVPNQFFFDEATGAEHRKFNIELSHTYEDEGVNALPALIIEDAAGAQQLGLTIDQRKYDTISPERSFQRQDLVRFTYVFHCLSSRRGESRALASIVASAITGFKDYLRAQGINKLEPVVISTTQPVRVDSDEDYVTTPVQVTFYLVNAWRTVEIPTGTAQEMDLLFVQPDIQFFVPMSCTIANPESDAWLHMSVFIQAPSFDSWMHMASILADPVGVEFGVLTSAELIDPMSSSTYTRMSAKIKAP